MPVAGRFVLAVGFLAVASLAACGQDDSPGEPAGQPVQRTVSPSTIPGTVPATVPAAVPTAGATAPSPEPTSTPVPPSGDEELTTAPDFTLPSANGSPVTLSELTAEQPVVLVFYRAFW